MAFPTPTELGRIMCLSPESFAVTRCDRVVSELRSEVGEIVGNLIGSAKWSYGGRLNSYVEDFNSMYLLSLVRSAVSNGPEDLRQMYLAIAAWAALGRHSTFRLVREHPELALTFHDAAARRLLDGLDALNALEPGIVENEHGSARRREMCRRTCDFIDWSRALVTYLPLRVPLKPLPLPVRVGLQLVAARYQSDASLTGVWNAHFSANPLGRCLSELTMLARQKTASGMEPVRRRSPNQLWWCCQLQVDENGVRRTDAGSISTACVELLPGQEMLACGQCGAVRYCSEEHQKADWKRHKKICFRPTW